MPAPVADRSRRNPPSFPPKPSRSARIVRRLGAALAILLVSAAVAGAFVLLLSLLAHVGRLAWNDLDTTVDSAVDRMVAPYCDPPADR